MVAGCEALRVTINGWALETTRSLLRGGGEGFASTSVYFSILSCVSLVRILDCMAGAADLEYSFWGLTE